MYIDVENFVKTCTDMQTITDYIETENAKSTAYLSKANIYTLLRAVVCYQKTIPEPDYAFIDHILKNVLPLYEDKFYKNFVNRRVQIHTSFGHPLCIRHSYFRYILSVGAGDTMLKLVQCGSEGTVYIQSVNSAVGIANAKKYFQLIALNNNKWAFKTTDQRFLTATRTGVYYSKTCSQDSEFYITIYDLPCDYDKVVLGENVYLDGLLSKTLIAENNTPDTNEVNYTSFTSLNDTFSYEELYGMGRTVSGKLNISPRFTAFNVISYEQVSSETENSSESKTVSNAVKTSVQYSFKLSHHSRLIKESQPKKQEVYIVYVEKYIGGDVVISLRRKVKHYMSESFRIETIPHKGPFLPYIA